MNANGFEADAFRSSTSLTTVYLPEQVKSIGSAVFTGCPVQYLVLLNHDDVVSSADVNGLPTKATVFVQESLVEGYQAHDTWKAYDVCTFTGKPVVTAQPANRQYGRKQATLTYKVAGAPIDGEPELTCDVLAETTTPVGDYVISIAPGTITDKDVELVEGVLTITPAPLTITANSYTRKQGEDNPEFEFTCKGFRNKEKEDVLLTQPVITCEATKDSPAGEYAIVISGATAQNYDITFVDGILTVEGASGIGEVTQRSIRNTQQYYDLQGRRVLSPLNSHSSPLKKGIYVDGRRLRVITQ